MEGFKEKSERAVCRILQTGSFLYRDRQKTGTFLGKNTNQILVFVIDDSLGMGGGVWWFKTSLLKEVKKSKKNLTIQYFRLHIHT